MAYNNRHMSQQKKLVNSGPVVLVILDGFGWAPESAGNVINKKTVPNFFQYWDNYPHTLLKAHGEAVGLFPNQQGNSEAGHINLGSGRVVKQDLVQISDAIHDGTFFKNEAFRQALYHCQKYHTAVHVLGLLTDGNSAHAYPEHLYAMLEFFRREGQKEVYLHLITDGRDSPPHGALNYLHELRGHLLAGEKIATITGRFYSMDRNKFWDRTQAAYEAMVLGKGCQAASAEEAISQAYNRGETDEYICPTVIQEGKKSVGLVKDNDAIFFINARSDRARQIAKAFVQIDFQKRNPQAFRRSKFPQNTRFVAMTDFGPDLDHIMTAFPSQDLVNTLPMVLGDLRQLYVAESEKYAHITYFFNGGYADPVAGEEREKISSPNVRHYNEQPAMSALGVTRAVLASLEKKQHDFICLNFANPDMIGHTGDMEAARQGLAVVDKSLQKIVRAALKKKGKVLIVADHGNAEDMLNLETGEMRTEHTTNLVPCVLVDPSAGKKKGRPGSLADVAPTILKLYGRVKPKEMTGRALF